MKCSASTAVSQRAMVDLPVIDGAHAHERISADIELHAEMNEQEQATVRAAPPDSTAGRYTARDPLHAHLDSA